MSSEAITRNDLTAILNDVLPPTPSEYRKLLWTNSSPSNSFAGQTITLNLSDYDEVAIIYGYSNTTWGVNRECTTFARVGHGGVLMQSRSDTIYSGYREFTVSTSGITFTDALLAPDATATNTQIIPHFIYGIKYERVAPPQTEIADYIVEQGTSGIWTYRKWNSGIAECWGTYHWNITSWTKWGEIYYSNGSGNINYPSRLFKTSTAPTAIAVGRSNTDDTMLIADNDYPTPGSPVSAAGFFLARPANGTSNSQDGYIHIHAMGVWK